jgi:hypothetical protein
MDITVTRDLAQLQVFIKKSLDIAFRFPVFQDMRVGVAASNLDQKAFKLISPQYNADNLFLIVRKSNSDDRFKPDSIYIKWEYVDYGGIRYQTSNYLDLQATIDIDQLLST